MYFSISFRSLFLSSSNWVCILSNFRSFAEFPWSCYSSLNFHWVLLYCFVRATDFPVGSSAELFEVWSTLLALEVHVILNMFRALVSYFELSTDVSNLSGVKDVFEMLLWVFVWIVTYAHPVVWLKVFWTFHNFYYYKLGFVCRLYADFLLRSDSPGFGPMGRQIIFACLVWLAIGWFMGKNFSPAAG